jgi:hypothetical protein
MSAALQIRDETTRGEVVARLTLVLPSDRVTAREIIERRVRAEVDAFNRQQENVFHGLVQPSETECVLNGYRMREHRRLDADVQVARACEAFLANGFFMLVGDRQIEALEEEVVVLPGTSVSFIKLLALVGG